MLCVCVSDRLEASVKFIAFDNDAHGQASTDFTSKRAFDFYKARLSKRILISILLFHIFLLLDCWWERLAGFVGT